MSTSELPLLESQPTQFKTSRRQSLLTNYDPSAYPADLDFARKHGQSQRVGHYMPPKEDVERCPCCLCPIAKPQLDLSCDIKQLLHIGCAYGFYLAFIKQCMLLVAVNLALCGLPALYINLSQGNMCVQLDGLVYSFYGLICKSSVINIMNVTEIDMLEVQSAINFVCIWLSVFLIAFMDVSMLRQYRQYYKNYHILPRASDYSVLIKGLPKDITISEIQEFVSSKLQEKGALDHSVLKIYLIYNLKTYYALYSNKRQILEEITVLKKQSQDILQEIEGLSDGSRPFSERVRLLRIQKETSEKTSELENKKEMIEIEINNYEELFKMVVNRITNEQPIDPNAPTPSEELVVAPSSTLSVQFSGKCIVTLNSAESRECLTRDSKNLYLLQKLGYQVGECLGGVNSPIVMVDAPEPSEIIFSNIGSNKIKRWKDSICVTAFLSLLILLDFVLLTLEKKLVKEEKAINNQNLMLSFMNSQIIALFNSLVSRVIRSFENRTQMHSTTSAYYYSVTSKLVVLLMINMLVTTFFSNLVNYYLFNEKTQTFDRFPLNFEEYLFDIFFLLITNPFTSFFLIFFDHRQGYKFYKRYQIEHQALPVTQAEANLHYENMQVDLSNKYCNVYRFVLFTAGVCFIFPPALLICLLTISGFYWLDKYLLLRRYVVAHKLNFSLTERLQKLMWYFPMMMALTNLIIMFVPIRDGKAFEEGRYSKAYYYLSLISVVATVLIFLGGCNWVIRLVERFCFRSESGQASPLPHYRDIERDFEEDYWHYYPYFKVKRKDEGNPGSYSPRKSKIEEMNRKVGMDVFAVMKNHLHHDRYAPMV